MQIQHYMAVTGYAGSYIAVLIGGNSFRWTFVERDEEMIAMLIQLEGLFWNQVQAMSPPSLDGSDASVKFLNARFPKSSPKSKVELPDAAVEIIRQYEVACENVNQYNVQKQEAENLLKQMLGDCEIGTAGEHLVSWKSVLQERLDGKTLKAEHPVLYKKYANQTSYRRFSIKATV